MPLCPAGTGGLSAWQGPCSTCPLGFFSAGGTLNAPYQPCTQCPWGNTTTVVTGATSAAQCTSAYVPPPHPPISAPWSCLTVILTGLPRHCQPAACFACVGDPPPPSAFAALLLALSLPLLLSLPLQPAPVYLAFFSAVAVCRAGFGPGPASSCAACALGFYSSAGNLTTPQVGHDACAAACSHQQPAVCVCSVRQASSHPLSCWRMLLNATCLAARACLWLQGLMAPAVVNLGKLPSICEWPLDGSICIVLRCPLLCSPSNAAAEPLHPVRLALHDICDSVHVLVRMQRCEAYACASLSFDEMGGECAFTSSSDSSPSSPLRAPSPGHLSFGTPHPSGDLCKRDALQHGGEEV